jgi:hypothetical protein
MSVGDFVAGCVIVFVIVVPVAGLTARLTLKPMVDSILRLRESFGSGAGGGAVERRVLELDEEVRRLRDTIARLEEAEAFHRSLAAAPETPARIESGER